jgi:hypothetical protein
MVTRSKPEKVVIYARSEAISVVPAAKNKRRAKEKVSKAHRPKVRVT